MKLKNFTPVLLLASLFAFCSTSNAQVVIPIDNYSVNYAGQVQLSIQAQAGKYYILTAQHSPTFEWATSITMGVNGTMVISEPNGAYPVENYTITEYDISNPGDIDGDGIDDITEYNNMPTDAPINFAEAVDFIDGSTSIPDAETFMELATINNVGWAPFLDDQLYVKFGILDRDTPEPKVYFINSNTHYIHANFFNSIGANVTGDDGSGEIVFNPNTITSNGIIGSYSFNFSFGNAYDFEDTQRTFELLAANMPFLQNNLNHFIGQGDEGQYLNQYADQYEGSRIEVVLESEVFADINFIPFHEAEGYGFFKHMNLDETPGSRDIVLYDALPNSLPRVGGIITSVVQTPLSHVNLRAIQDNVPNAYIEDPLSIDSISSLLGGYVHYIVENETFQIHEATLEEVNDWYEDLRPTEPQIPERDLSITEIMPLDDIEFDMSTAFGAKCSNVATMRTFDFPEGTIPDGFGIPFYFYDEFMQYNNFYEEAQVMIENPAFINDINFRIDRLDMFRDDIRDAPMPQWMMDELQAMHESFPVGTKVRCRSSTNNEDLPGFSGAGLYTSKTQHLDEGHISKSIKQVYASMWNFRAYEERDFYRVDHFMAAMGILCHPNFEDEKSNGVGISLDPIYETENTFYLNTQVGESLITNPDPNSVPEEILLYEDPEQGAGYLVLNLSNLVEEGELVMDQIYLDQMREYLTVIHDEFAILYDVDGIEGFGMDIEYKVTAQDQLAIKQARPWVSFWADIKADNDLEFTEFITPVASAELGSNEIVSATISNTGLNDMSDFELTLFVDDEFVETISIDETIEPFSSADFEFTIPQDFSNVGNYTLSGIVFDEDDEYGNNDTLNYVLTKIHDLDVAVLIESISVDCDGSVFANIIFSNEGGDLITGVGFFVTVNGNMIGFFTEDLEIESGEQDMLSIEIDDYIEEFNNTIEVELTSANSEVDGEASNNMASLNSNLESTFDMITIVINADDYPNETSWDLLDLYDNVIATGELNWGDDGMNQTLCVDYTSCYTLKVYDSYGDGICCSYGYGNFSVLNVDGETIVSNDGDFGSLAVETFCPGVGCNISADISVDHSTDNNGAITIYTYTSSLDLEFSINGGLSFSSNNTFTNLSPGEYNIVVASTTGDCSYTESVYIEECTLNNVEIDSIDVGSSADATGSIVFTPVSGVGPYMYSVDGGQNFYPENEFLNLPIGNYNIVIIDATGVCSFETNVSIEVDSTIGIVNNNLATTDINIFPNPTTDLINIEVKSNSGSNNTIEITLYDNWGRILESGNISADDYSMTTINLSAYVPGIYFLKFFNEGFEKHYQVIKI